MAEPPERPHPDRYNALRSFEKGNTEKPPEENLKPETARGGGPRTSHMPAVQSFMNDYNKDAQAHMKNAHVRAVSERNDKWEATAKGFEEAISTTTMNDKTTSGKEDQSSDKTARENLAREIAAEKQKTGEKQQEKPKDRERGD